MFNCNAIGENLKKIRTEMDLSLGEISKVTGVSKTMLSQIERGESVPTVATMWKITNGLKITFATLLGQHERLFEVKNLEDAVLVKDDGERILIYCTHPFSPLTGLEVFYGELKPGCAYFAGSHKNSAVEHIFVYEGEIELETGLHKYTIPANSWISFDANLEHAYYNHAEKVAKVHFVVSYK